MNTKIFLMSLIFLFNSCSFAGKIHRLADQGDLQGIKNLIESEEYKNNKKKLKEIINSQSVFGFTPLHIAVSEGRLDIAKLLLQNGADPNAQNRFSGNTPLHLTVSSKGYPEIAKLLLANKANPNAKNNKGDTPLHFAAFKGYQNIAEILVKNRAAPNAKNKKNKTPLDVAYDQGHGAVSNFLEGVMLRSKVSK